MPYLGASFLAALVLPEATSDKIAAFVGAAPAAKFSSGKTECMVA